MKVSSINKIRDFPLVKFYELQNETVLDSIFTLTFTKLRRNKNSQWPVLHALGGHLASAHRHPAHPYVVGQKTLFIPRHV